MISSLRAAIVNAKTRNLSKQHNNKHFTIAYCVMCMKNAAEKQTQNGKICFSQFESRFQLPILRPMYVRRWEPMLCVLPVRVHRWLVCARFECFHFTLFGYWISFHKEERKQWTKCGIKYKRYVCEPKTMNRTVEKNERERTTKQKKNVYTHRITMVIDRQAFQYTSNFFLLPIY